MGNRYSYLISKGAAFFINVGRIKRVKLENRHPYLTGAVTAFFVILGRVTRLFINTP